MRKPATTKQLNKEKENKENKNGVFQAFEIEFNVTVHYSNLIYRQLDNKSRYVYIPEKFRINCQCSNCSL